MRNVPKLRFKEFTDEWEEKRLGEISNIKGGYAFKSQNFLNNKSKYQVIKMGNIYKNKLLLDKSPSYLDEISEKEKDYLLEKDDIILTLTGTVGKRDFGYSCQIKEEKNLLLNQRLACIKSKKEIINRKFLRYIISHQNFLDIFFEISMGGTGNQANVSIKDICDIIVKIGENKEQQKIADFLSSVDKKISITEEKLSLFNEYKKGIMQKIFNQELRFKNENGNDYPEWEEKALSLIFERITEKNIENNDNVLTISAQYGLISQTDFENGNDYPEWEEKALSLIFERITEKNIENNDNVLTISAQYGLISQTDFFNKSVAGKDLTKYYLLHRNDFAYNKSYSTGYPMGAIKRLTKYDKGVVSTLYICFRTKNNDNVDFLEQFFESKKIEKSIQDIAQEGARNHGLLNINIGDFFDITIKLPCLKEQKKIANFLSAIDTKIEKISYELENLKEFKKGLLQQMFV